MLTGQLQTFNKFELPVQRIGYQYNWCRMSIAGKDADGLIHVFQCNAGAARYT